MVLDCSFYRQAVIEELALQVTEMLISMVYMEKNKPNTKTLV